MSNRAKLTVAADALTAIYNDVKEKNQMIDAEETHGAEWGKGRRAEDLAECEQILEEMMKQLDRLDFLL